MLEVELARKKGEPMVPQEWVGKRVEVDLVRPGPTLMGATYQGTLNAVTDLGPRNGSGSTPGARCCPSISPGRARGLDLRNRVGHIPIEARFDLYIWLIVRDHDISCQWRTAHTPSRGLSQAFRGASIILT